MAIRLADYAAAINGRVNQASTRTPSESVAGQSRLWLANQIRDQPFGFLAGQKERLIVY
jgi:hypothetical protein